ncbi:MAG: hypothetical protein KJ646_01370 [Nanoarchaeota archaeon]|nr:hypothetical protein [Nanoarchaeota archaeon]
MESIYERKITLQEELRMKYEAVKCFVDLGYEVKQNGEDILIFRGKDNIGKLTYSKEENVPMAVVEKRKFHTNDLLKILMEKGNRDLFKNTLLDLGWAVSSYDEALH